MAELKLNPQQQRFLLAIVEGKSATEAYKIARFPTGVPSTRTGKELTRNDLSKRASELMKSPVVAGALARARAAAADRAQRTVDDIVARLDHVYEVALSCDPPQTSGAVAAQMGIAKLLGLVIDRSQVMVEHKPALSSKQVELDESEWRQQFAPQVTKLVTKPKDR